MNDFQKVNLRRQVLRALRIAGATTWTVTRAERDANGMPTGETREVCTLFGLVYQKAGQMSNLLAIAMPGVMLPGAGDGRWYGVVLMGDVPQAGDALRPHPGETGRQIVQVQDDLGVITMVLGGVTE